MKYVCRRESRYKMDKVLLNRFALIFELSTYTQHIQKHCPILIVIYFRIQLLYYSTDLYC